MDRRNKVDENMDKESALKLTREYLIKVRKSDIDFSEAWLFGSFAKGSNHENSDIDLAIVLSKNNKSFDTEVKLMTSACPPGR